MSNLGLLAFKASRIEEAEAHCLQSNQIARPRDFHAVVFRNCYYLWKIASTRGDEAAVRSNERSLRTYLSRVEDHLPEAVEFRQHLTEIRR